MICKRLPQKVFALPKTVGSSDINFTGFVLLLVFFIH